MRRTPKTVFCFVLTNLPLSRIGGLAVWRFGGLVVCHSPRTWERLFRPQFLHQTNWGRPSRAFPSHRAFQKSLGCFFFVCLRVFPERSRRLRVLFSLFLCRFVQRCPAGYGFPLNLFCCDRQGMTIPGVNEPVGIPEKRKPAIG